MKELPKSTEDFQVYFYTSPAHKPFHFAVHPWVVTVHKGLINRWEIIHKKYNNKTRSGFVYKNFYTNPTQGIKQSYFADTCWSPEKVTLIGGITGNKNSLAAKMLIFIETQAFHYEHKNQYTIWPGPNSNTFAQWILDQFPDAQIMLPWNAIGKNYGK